jgi:hypothetical protein
LEVSAELLPQHKVEEIEKLESLYTNSLRVDEGELRGDCKNGAEAVKQAVRRTAVELTGNIRENSLVDHGRLVGSWNMKATGSFEL